MSLIPEINKVKIQCWLTLTIYIFMLPLLIYKYKIMITVTNTLNMERTMKKIFIIVAICLAITSISGCKRSTVVSKIDKFNLEYEKDITYKSVDDIDLKLDIYKPINNVYDKTPVVVYIHGGAFIKGTKNNINNPLYKPTVIKMLELGYAIVSIDYRLLDGNTLFPDNIVDCKDALRWINKNADVYNFDKNNIGVWGTSAGGNLALMMGSTTDDSFIGDETLSEYSSSVNYVIDFFGSTDLLLSRTNNRKNVNYERLSTYYDIQFEENTSEDEQMEILQDYNELYSPIYYISSNSVPTLIVHGTTDKLVDISQSDLLSEALENNGISYKNLALKGVGHGLININEEQQNNLVAEVERLLTDNYVSP